MKKVLFVATVVKKHINVFHLPYLKWFQQNGYETHVCAGNDFENKDDLVIPYCDKYYELPFQRSPFKMENIYVYKKLKKIINENNYDIIHCHTPMGGALVRLAAKESRKNGTKVIYTAHGFHFFKGAPLKNWLIYYPIEKLLSKYTDCIITINNEDYQVAKNKFKAESIKLVNGVGININKFSPPTLEFKLKLRNEYGYKENDLILIYVGELSYRKHQDLLINTVSEVASKIPNIKLLLVGTGDLLEQYQQLVNKLELKNKVEFLGFRNDVDKLMSLSDIAVSSSRQEGLPVNIMEAMATGLPLVVTDCRGNRDLVKPNENGFLIGIDEAEKFSVAVEEIYKSKILKQKFREKSLDCIKSYSLESIIREMGKIYLEQMK